MTFPTPWTVEVLPYQGGTEDPYGNATDTYGAAVLELVYGWAPAGTNENNASRHTVVSDISVFAPSDFTADSLDHIRVDGIEYEIDGDVEDYDHGPFGFQPGVRVNLRRSHS